MSFQDFGRPSNNSSNVRNESRNIGPSTGGYHGGESSTSLGTSSKIPYTGYASISDAILQYQRNVGILGNIIEEIGRNNDTNTVQSQLKLQIDVIKQIGAKVEKQLQEQEMQIGSLSRQDASKSRATHIKLTRDYRRVETAFKNHQLEAKRRFNAREALQREELEYERRKQFEEGIDHDTLKLQMQLQNDRINEEIIREREEEIRNINRGMHQVNEIYKDLALIVNAQQEMVDEVENHMEDANKNAESGLKQVEKAAKASESSCIIS